MTPLDDVVVSRVTVIERLTEQGERDWYVESDPEDMSLANIIGLLETGKAWLLIDLLKDEDRP